MIKNVIFFMVHFIFISTSVLSQVQGPIYPGDPMVNGVITQSFNVPWSKNKDQQHTGVDYSAEKEQPVYATNSGTVTKVGNLGESDSGEPWGEYVVVKNSDGRANGFLHIVPSVLIGQNVEPGEKIGTVFKDHLHYNECVQSDGCQHGAFPNPTFKDKNNSATTNYYIQPEAFNHTNPRKPSSNLSSAFIFKSNPFRFSADPFSIPSNAFSFQPNAFSFNQPNSSTKQMNANNQNKK